MHPILNQRPNQPVSSLVKLPGSSPGPAANDSPEPPYGEAELQLELQRVRSAAEAARLEARAAEIELLLNRCQAKSNCVAKNPKQITPAKTPSDFTSPAPATTHSIGAQLTSWQDLLDAAERLEETDPSVRQKLAPPVLSTVAPVTLERPSIDIDVDVAQKITGPKQTAPVLRSEQVATRHSKPVIKPAAIDEQPAPRRRIRPGAWISSLVGHGIGLAILAWITLAVAEPKDQIALSAAIVPNDESNIQTIVIEQADQPNETEPSETELESMAEAAPTSDLVSSVSVLSVSISAPQSAAPAMTSASLLGDALGQSLAMGVSGASGAAGALSTQFFGAEGGGNHFVYLVDNSGSMDNISRDGFDVARNEVLRAVASLRSEQRFYVVFFGEQTLKMQLDSTQPPSSQSVYATDENKAALRRWALGLTMQPGKWPEEALEFAFELRPDCIFLLTDGAMPNYVGNVIKEANTMDTLFYGPKPRSIIHTIGFHNSEGEAQLRSIAESNGGTYHFVPAKPARQ